MRQYNHFNINERETIFEMLAKGNSIRSIAKDLNRSPSSISRELKRNSLNNRYSPSQAHSNYINNKSKCGAKRKILDPIIKNKVQDLFLKFQWSPEQISNRLKIENYEFSISYNTIYRAIYDGFLEEKKLESGQRGVIRKLRHRGKTRHTKGHVETRGKIVITNSLDERPQIANDRDRLGDWEADTVLGKTGKSCLVTLTDRKSRFLLCARIERKNSLFVRDAMIEILHGQPLESITPDRGKEFSRHKEISSALNSVEFYWPLPSHPWDRGTNENTNGLLREYFPKNEDLTLLSEQYITEKIKILNKRPRKCLGWKSPYEIYYNVVLQLI